MKKKSFLFTLALTAILSLLFVISCNKDDSTGGDNNSGNNLISANISENTTWETGKVYILGGRIAVLSGVTLTIQPGVIIKGEAGSGANATALIIARGGKIMAEGTASQPIIFTTVADEIKPGQIASPNMDPELNGLWGGLIILGKAPISAPGDVEAFQIEGIPATDQNGLYGGTDPADNSGVIKYVSIRHGGANIGEGNEINGITLGGVGSGTTLDHVEVISNQDDGIEIFGGTVTVKNILVWNPDDDMFDVDQNSKVTVDNFIGIAGSGTDHGMELDGPEGSATPDGFTLKNGSLKGWNEDGTGGGEYADLRDGVACTITDCYFFNFSDNSDIELDAGENNDDNTIADLYTAGKVTFTNLEFNVSHLSSGNLTVTDIFADKLEGSDVFASRAPGASIVTSPTVGADKSQFTGWTWADIHGELSDF